MDGDLIQKPYQYEFRNFLFGSGTRYQTETVDGLLTMADIRSNDIERGGDHGDSPGTDLLAGKTITFAINVLGDPGEDVEKLLSEMRKPFQVSKRNPQEFPLVFERPLLGKRRINVRCRKREFQSNYDTAHGLAKGGVMFYATDPRIYSNEERVVQLAIPVGQTQIQGNVVNTGDFEDGTEPIFEITGPCTNPRITNVEQNRAVRVDIVLGQTDKLLIDVRNRTIQLSLNGAAYTDAYDKKRTDNQWWSLFPDANTILYSRTGNGNASTLTIRFRDAWV